MLMIHTRGAVAALVTVSLLTSHAQAQRRRGRANTPPDAVMEAQTTQPVAASRPEQQLTEHDRSDVFYAGKARPESPVFKDQPKEGKINGFDFVRDPLNADRPFMTFEQILHADVEAKPGI